MISLNPQFLSIIVAFRPACPSAVVAVCVVNVHNAQIIIHRIPGPGADPASTFKMALHRECCFPNCTKPCYFVGFRGGRYPLLDPSLSRCSLDSSHILLLTQRDGRWFNEVANLYCNQCNARNNSTILTNTQSRET